ncbi:MAG: hypothetical protein NC340_08980 [Ruminococcus flavefaciens]|nr:hypothetical protein [Ruminococcus flavefaciens]MCM1230944.1 hypothetical protein [Ruminococcus flavefaciens]
MEKNRTIQRRSSKKKKKPKVRFNFWVMFIIFALSFIACFVLYMLAANFNDDFFKDEFKDNPVVGTQDVGDDIPQTTGSADNTDDEADKPSAVANPVPQSEAVEESYFNSSCLITDSTLIEMGTYGKFSKTNVFGSAELNADNCNTTKIDSTFGNSSVYDIIKNKKPSTLYIMLGSDLGTSDTDSMIKNYTMLVNNLHSALPDMKIYIMQIPPVIYDSEALTNDMINEYNDKLLAMCNTVGIYCIDTNTALKGENGMLAEEFYSYENLALSGAGYSKICEYILTHTV